MSVQRRRLFASFALLTTLSSTKPLQGQTKNQSSANQGVQLPQGPPTIPNDVMFSLGQQSNQLTMISSHLDKVDTKIDGMQNDITRLNTYASVFGVVLLAFCIPLVLLIIGPWINRKVHGSGPPNPQPV